MAIEIGTTIETTDGRTGEVTQIKGRWLTVTGPEEEFKISKSSVSELTKAPETDEDAIALAASAPLVMADEELTEKRAIGSELTCPECGTVTPVVYGKTAYQCKKCGLWLYVRIPADRSHYFRGLGETAGGNDTLDIGDESADLLRGLSEKECLEVTAGVLSDNRGLWTKGFAKQAKQAGATTAEEIYGMLADKFGARNPGMTRMNCGNLVRGICKKLAIDNR